MKQDRSSFGLPINGSLRSVSIASLCIVALIVIASAASLAFQAKMYPAMEVRRTFLPNDVANLVIGAPALLVSMGLARRGLWVGVLFWPGAVLYVLYNYLAALLSLPSVPMIGLSAALVALCFYVLTGLMRSTDGAFLRNRLGSKALSRISGSLLAVLGILTLTRAISVLAAAALGHANPGVLDVAVSIVDCLIAPVFIVCGVFLFRQRALGYLTGLGLLLTANLLFSGLIVFMLAQPLTGGARRGAADFLTIGGAGLVFLIPFVFFVRGVHAAQRQCQSRG
jgi:hypothetical protein